jgi:S-adenosylmethionine:tRNA ribosyltransferase-isomerase
MTDVKKISIADFTYDLPPDRIALHPLPVRDASKLLIYRNGRISEDIYKNIADHFPADSFLVFNNTKVIRARIKFQKPTGGVIEIFCLEPYEDINEYSSIMSKKDSVKWKCMIGGASKWKEGGLHLTVGGSPFRELEGEGGSWQSAVGTLSGVKGNYVERSREDLILKAKLTEKLSDAYVVEFSWEPSELTFAEVIEAAGDIPLPPYIKRDTDIEDKTRYQTIYAKDEGSVAAPTAGLHFTEDIFNSLAIKNIQTDFVTLHVGAGTFKPVKSATMQEHEMHAEWIDVSKEFIQNLINNIDKSIIAVGTTSLRTIESLYWMGVKVHTDPSIRQIMVGQWKVYETPLNDTDLSARGSLDALLEWMNKNEKERIFTQTQILIAPGYKFRIAKALVTNFHQPQSTLLLLVAAAIGDDWRKAYNYALENNFRFLSYGDGSLLFMA